MRSPSLRARLALWSVIVVLAVLALSAGNIVLLQERIGIRRIDRELDGTRVQLTHMLREEFSELDAPRLAAEESLAVIASATRRVAIFSEGGEVLATNFEGPGLADLLTAGTPTPGARTIESQQRRWRLLASQESFDGVKLSLVVASSLDELSRDYEEMREALFLGIPIALLLAAAGGLWLASIGLRPITIMARRARNLPLNGLDDLGPPLRDDELGQLTRAFNAVVSRLRSALQTQRQFMADASHELRNPLSVIRSASDVALSSSHRDEAEYREALAMISAQSRRLGTLVEDMLVLARADAGGYPIRPMDFFIDDVIDECWHLVKVLASERGVHTTSTGASDVAIRADQELVRRLLMNLLQNALQHTPPGGTVRVDVSQTGRNVCIRVIDTGAGIASDDLGRIFDRFVQLDPSRRADGAGLGLTIAKWIAEAHQGSLVVESSGPQGTTFCLMLPTGDLMAAHEDHPEAEPPIVERAVSPST